MKKPEIIIADKKTCHSITSDALSKVQSLLYATKTLLDDIVEYEVSDDNSRGTTSIGDPTVAAGLYTFAVEEYGKYLYLKSLEAIGGKYHIEYTKEFTNHKNKFERALSNLPNECKLVRLGENKNSKFYELDFQGDVVADFETRLRFFYSDFDPSFENKIRKFGPSVSANLLKIGVQKLLKIVDSEGRKIWS